MNRLFLQCLTLLVLAASARAVEFHVATNGSDADSGTEKSPFRTIQHASALAQPGDVVTVHEGIYREQVDPPRGGTSDKMRITYQAAPGERVTITGAEPVRGWVKVSGDTWKVACPSRQFGGFNPYLDRIRGDWFLPQGRIHHSGCVYLDGEWLVEARSLDEVMKPAGATPSWFATVDGDKGEYLVDLAWLKPGKGQKVPAGDPSWRYGGKPAACSEGGTCSGYITAGDQLRFDDVDFGTGSDTVEFRAAAQPGAGALIELRLGSAHGERLGTCKVEVTGDWQNWQSFTAKIKPLTGKQTLCLVFLNEAVAAGNTTIYAQFPGADPNTAAVEMNARQTVFYPSRNYINCITVRGFTLEKSAASWAPPSSEQKAVIGVNWSKGWIIENNTVRYSKCAGISLGKYGDGTDNTNDAGTADPYTACVRRALQHGWNKATIGGHIVRNNHVSFCEQVGIVGSLGCAFSTVSGNVIHDIWTRRLFSGYEMAGIKFHGAVDTVITGNHIYNNGCFGIWLDWMAQGAQVTGNLIHDNGQEDLFCEMQHGPLLVANNILVSRGKSLFINSKGLAFAHNLITGGASIHQYDERKTPFHPPHSTEIAGLYDAPGGDHRFYNNLFTTRANAAGFSQSRLPCVAAGNVFAKGAQASKFDTDALVLPAFDAAPNLVERDGAWWLTLSVEKSWSEKKRPLVDTALLGKAKIPNCDYENPDGSPIKIVTDYFGNKRDAGNPFPGPFEMVVDGEQRIKVWPVWSAR